MPLLEIIQARQISATIRVDETTAEQIDQYAAFLHASADEVVDKALGYVFAKDRDFQEFLRTAQLAFDGQMSALRKRLRVLGQPAPNDAAMPLGMAVVFACLLVLVAGLGGKRENGEAGVVGGAGDGVVAEEADERDAILYEVVL